tara:strand:+ start:1450 stop:2862 length:1413 start_codon:yes stop_codon:yes gene_type:complete
MAEQTYTVTVASGNLYGGGTGNVYYLDGARNATGPGTVSWVNGGALRFEQSDASNDSHPLIFSTTTSKDQYLTSGVTYYLDGASNYAAYINTTSFNSATTRYVEVTPSSETDFYYLCYVHGIGMGGIFDITQSTYGALKWSQGNWNAQNNSQVIATGQSANSNIGNVTAEGLVELGWGGDTYGENNWGDLEDEVATVTGVSAQTSVNSVAFAGATEGWGRPSWNLAAWGVTGDVLAQGQQLNSSPGSVVADGTIEEGWGRKTYGNESWGEAFAVSLTGQTATTAIGTAIGKADFSIQLSGLTALSLSLANNYSIQIDNNQFVNASEATLNTTAGSVQQIITTANVAVTGISASTSVGSAVAEPKIPVDVTGIQASLSLGTTSLIQTTNLPVTTAGLLSISQGSAQQASVYPVTTAGLLNSSAGSTTQTTTANVTVTGIGLTASIGAVNITSWNEIDLGVNNTWTEVDLAA